MMLMFHDDDCGELLDADGKCGKCGFYPDMQSTAYREVADSELRPLLKAGRSVFVKLPPP
jgi:hypothetical protein